MDYYIKDIKENKGAPRIYLDGLQASMAGIEPGEKYTVVTEGDRLTLKVCKDGTRVVTKRVKGERVYPVIDLNSKDLLSIFEGMDQVRMIVRHKEIIFLPLASEAAKKERLDRLVNDLASGKPLITGSLNHGFGILAKALHDAYKEAGLNPETRFVNELAEDLVMQAMVYNDSHNENTIHIQGDQAEIWQDEWLWKQIGKIHALDLSLPCSGASQAGSTKLQLEKMEDHPEVGHLVFSALAIIAKTQPAVLLLENVKQYAKSASAEILRKQLRGMGYNIHEAVVNGKDFGLLEARERWCMVGVTEGLDFTFDNISPKLQSVKLLEDYLDPSITPDDPRYTVKHYLLDKKEREDRESKKDPTKKKGFGTKPVTTKATQVPTLRKGYHKGGSDDFQVIRPGDEDKDPREQRTRLVTGDEHLAIKEIDPSLFTGMSNTKKHEGAGQAVQPGVFKVIGKRLGQSIRDGKTYGEYKKIRRMLDKQEASMMLGEGIAYDPAPPTLTLVKNVTLDLFADLGLESEPPTNTNTPPKKQARRRVVG